MNTKASLQIFKALADSSRLQIIQTLLEKSGYVEEIAERFQLSPSTVSFHLKKLENAGLVTREKQQYYVMFSPSENVLTCTLKDLILNEKTGHKVENQRVDEYKQKIINSFFVNGRITRLPAQYKKKLMIVEFITAEFEYDKIYPEKQVDETIAKFYDDYCTIRRIMVDEGYMTREKGQYKRITNVTDKLDNYISAAVKTTQKGTHIMDRKTELKKAYKLNPPPMGIFRILNKQNGKMFIVSSQNIPGIMNKYLFELNMGSSKNTALQKDWNEFGADNFDFEVLDELEHKNEPDYNPKADLEMLKEMWLEKLQPFGDKGYNKQTK